MLVLGIESSCDETAAALVRDDGTVLSDVVSSQIALHGPYGGVVPELASRAHVRAIVPVVRQALAAVPGGLADVEGIAATSRPGLVGALLVGLTAGKSIALARGLPFVGVDHLEGHLLAVDLSRGDAPIERAPRPFVALLASGGHTALYEVRDLDETRVPMITLLGQTRDDAAGEAFDKIAKLIGLGYPGGPVVERMSVGGDPRAVALPIPFLHDARMDRRERQKTKWLDRGSKGDAHRGRARRGHEFSFSGLKTAVVRHVAEWRAPPSEQHVRDLCASFQRVVVEVLARKAADACVVRGVRHLVLCGGVAANGALRARAVVLGQRAGVTVHVPPVASCTDNAAMIAYAGALHLCAGERHELDLKASSSSPLAS